LIREEIRKQLLSVILDLLKENDSQYIDQFPLDVLNTYANLLEKQRNHPEISTLLRALKQIHTSFFRINSINIQNFASTLSERMNSKIRVTTIDFLPSLVTSQIRGAICLSVDDIESFKEVRKMDSVNLPSVANMLEDTIKLAFSEIIGEVFVPLHSGAEKSDLFTSRLLVGNSRMNAAFVFKGRSVRGTLRIKNLGAPGNQIQRLLNEPADVFVVQYVNHIHSDVVQELKDLTDLKSVKENRQLYYCIIDGTDTARVLRAYNRI
jgi:hypothetical protein